MWVTGMTCGIIAHDREANTKLFQIVKRAFDNFPDALKPKARYNTKQELLFDERFDGVKLDSGIYVAMKIRSGTVQKLHITEIAYIKDYQELKAGSKQTVPLTGTISEESTGNGYNLWYDDFMESHKNKAPGPQDYKTYFYPWIINPEYQLPGDLPDKTPEEYKIIDIAAREHGIQVTDQQLLWRRWKKRELRAQQIGIGLSGDQLFKQEYPLTLLESFQSGAGNVFDPEKIEAVIPREKITEDVGRAWLHEHYPTDPTMVEQFVALLKSGVTFWHLPDKNNTFVTGCDPSDGMGADFSSISIWDHKVEVDDKVRQCAQYYGKLRPDELAQLNADLATFYHKAYAGVENNMLTTVLFLSQIYDNYHFDTTQDERTLKRKKKLGWNTNTKTRPIMIDDFMILFDEDELEINSEITLSEMRTFVKKDNGKREHADGKHDDALFADFIAIQMRKLVRRKARSFAVNTLQ